jgi:hypothetical protein
MQLQVESRPPAERPVTISVDGEPLGVLLRTGDAYRFLAVRLAAFPLDGQHFDSVAAAEAALAAAQRSQRQ